MQVSAYAAKSSASVKFVLKDPDKGSLRTFYGWSAERGGYWVEVHRDGMRIVYDALSESYDHGQPLLGALRFMAECSLLAPEDVADVVSWIDDAPFGGRRRAPHRLQRVLGVIRNLESAHG